MFFLCGNPELIWKKKQVWINEVFKLLNIMKWKFHYSRLHIVTLGNCSKGWRIIASCWHGSWSSTAQGLYGGLNSPFVPQSCTCPVLSPTSLLHWPKAPRQNLLEGTLRRRCAPTWGFIVVVLYCFCIKENSWFGIFMSWPTVPKIWPHFS